MTRANITRFIEYVNGKQATKLKTFQDLYAWSVDRIPDFWARLWEFADIKASCGYDQVVDDLDRFPGAHWFTGARLNFAENLLRYHDDYTAFIFKGETVKSRTMTYAELYDTVARLAKSLRECGVVPGDRVVGYLPNLIETAAAMLAGTSVGAQKRNRRNRTGQKRHVGPQPAKPQTMHPGLVADDVGVRLVWIRPESVPDVVDRQ